MEIVNDTKGLKISWVNCCGGIILLTQPTFSFPSITFPNMLVMWFCGDISKKIPPYMILRSKYVKHIKGGKQKISNMKYLVKQLIRAAGIVNRHDFVIRNCSPSNVLVLYLGVRNFFAFSCLPSDKTRRYEKLSRKTYFNAFEIRKGKLFGEQ